MKKDNGLFLLFLTEINWDELSFNGYYATVAEELMLTSASLTAGYTDESWTTSIFYQSNTFLLHVRNLFKSRLFQISLSTDRQNPSDENTVVYMPSQ